MIKSQKSTSDNPQKIKKYSIEDPEKRSAIFEKLFDGNAMKAEYLVYSNMNHLCTSYNGAYWLIYKLSNGGFYMAPKTETKFKVNCFGFGDSVKMSADGAGLVATLFAVNQLTFQLQHDKIINLYHKIREFAAEHPEAAEIFRAID